MRIRFADPKLQRLATEKRFTNGLGPDLVKAFRKAVGFLTQCVDERDIRGIPGYRFKKLAGDRDDQWSMRLNDQFRLIVQLKADEDGKLIVVLQVLDYH